MQVISVKKALEGAVPVDTKVEVRGWVRTRRDSKAGISFVNVSDGSGQDPIQVVAPNTLPNYQDAVLKLTAGCPRHRARHAGEVTGQGAGRRDPGRLARGAGAGR